MKPTHLVIHHSASPRSTTVAGIDAWHRARGWSGIGYHRIITEDGVTHPGRPLDRTGVHVRGHNVGTIGVCVTGDNTVHGRYWNGKQRAELRREIAAWKRLYPGIIVCGHRDLAATLCPGVDIRGVYDVGPGEEEA